MMKLPRHLSPWAEQLALFPEDLALTLGPMVSQIASLIGGWRTDHASSGAPDGYDGAALRGTYDRLLASEWLLLDEAPEEFMRRAVSGEHMFLRRAWREKAAAKRCVAFFDSGPEQLGAPRIAQIAALIVLAERARRHNAAFEWGVLQADAGKPSSSVDEAGLRALLDSRCAWRAASEDVGRWMSAAPPSETSEAWLVGAPRLADEARRHGAHALTVTDLPEPGAIRRLRVSAQTRHSALARETTLDAPAGAVAAQFLRGLWDRAAAASRGLANGGRHVSSGVDVKSNIIFAHGGKQLWARNPAGGVTAFPVPNSPNAGVALPAAFVPDQGSAVVAVAPRRWGRRTVIALDRGGGLEICVLTKRAGAIHERLAYIPYPDNERPEWAGPPLSPMSVFGRQHFYFCDSKNSIEISNNALTHAAGQDFIASTAAPCQHYVARRSPSAIIVSSVELANGKLWREDRSPGLSEPPFITHLFFPTGPKFTLATVHDNSGRCRIRRGDDVEKIEFPRGYTVAGMVIYGEPPKPTVILVNKGRNQILALREGSPQTVFTSASPIAHVAVSDTSPSIAYLTESSELGVFLCWRNGEIRRVAQWTAP